MVVLCCILVVTGFLPSPISRSSLSSPPSQVSKINLFIQYKIYTIKFQKKILYYIYNFVNYIILKYNYIYKENII